MNYEVTYVDINGYNYNYFYRSDHGMYTFLWKGPL